MIILHIVSITLQNTLLFEDSGYEVLYEKIKAFFTLTNNYRYAF